VDGFKNSLSEHFSKNSIKSTLLIGAGGVSPSIIYALKNLNVGQIFISNRTEEKARLLKDRFGPLLSIVPWNDLANKNLYADLVINATSLGLQKEETIDLNFSSFDKKTIFYDVIYNPHQTSFLKKAESLGYQTINGMMMFLYQAQLAYEIWNKQKPEIDTKLLNLVRQN
jgi:shikimate dehydrogenase